MSADVRGERSVADDLAEQLRRRILTGRYAPGDPLRQEVVADEFGVSRMPVREAFARLAATGLLELRPNRGAYVRGSSPEQIRNSYAVRAELEGLAARCAAEFITDIELVALREAAGMFEQAVERVANGDDATGTDELWRQANDRFHDILLRASGNAILRETVLQLHMSFPRSLTGLVLSASPVMLRRNVVEHLDILTAVQAADPAGARRAATRHVLRSGDLIARRYASVLAGADFPRHETTIEASWTR